MYCSLLRSVLEYASVIFANLPQYLCKALERVQKRALRIIFGLDLSYEHTLARAGLLSLEARRHLACKKFVTETMHASPLYRLIPSRVISSQTSYSLRSGSSCQNSCQLNMRRISIVCNNVYAMSTILLLYYIYVFIFIYLYL